MSSGHIPYFLPTNMTMTHTLKMLLLTTLLCLAATPARSGELGTIKTSPAVHNAGSSSLREPRRVTVTTPTYPCDAGNTTTCKCPAACMEPDSVANTWKGKRVCIVKRCYTYDPNLAQCKDDGPDFTSAIVLQAIPFTGAFGAGFGNMGRWDLFGVAMGLIFGGIGVACLLSCCCAALGAQDDGSTPCLVSCYACLWATAIVTWWIVGIVWIADKSVLGPHGCKLV